MTTNIIPLIDIQFMEDIFDTHIRGILSHYNENRSVSSNASTPKEIAAAIFQFLDVIKQIEHNETLNNIQTDNVRLKTADINQIGEYGLQLFSELLNYSRQFKLLEISHDIQYVCYVLAVWIAQKGGKLLTLEPVVNAIADIANQFDDPAMLKTLSYQVEKIVIAVSTEVRHDLEKCNPGRPLRLLMMNFAIIATRCLDPERMHIAFQYLKEYLPEEASCFFKEGMEQMDIIDYPQTVREVMESYYDECCKKNKAH